MRKIDKTKKSNIKCEHCLFWNCTNMADNGYQAICLCKDGPKYDMQTNYWNRCKNFEWKEN